MDDLKAFFNIVLLILFVAGSLLGPLVERWRRKKEAERRKLEGREETEAEAEPPPAPPPPHDGPDRPRLPYEEVLEDVFGSYIERRRREAEAKRLAEEAATAVQEAPAVEEEAPPPPPPPEPERRALVSMEEIRATASAEPAPPRRGRSLDDLLFRNPRLTPGARLLVAAEILGTPRSRRRR